MEIFANTVIGVALFAVFSLFVYLIACAASDIIDSMRSEPTTIILRRYKALPRRRLTEPVKVMRQKLKRLDDYYGIDVVNSWHWSYMHINRLSRRLEPIVKIGEDPVEYMELYNQIVAIEKAIEEQNKADKPTVHGLVKSLEVDAGQIKRGSR